MSLTKPKTSEPSVFANRNFSLFFSARIASQLGDNLYTFAVTWYILDLTGSSLQMTIPLMLTTIITAFVSLFGGTFADRKNRKQILVYTDIAQGIILVTMAVLVSFNSLQIWMIYLLTAILAFCSAIFSPAASALIPDIVLPEQIPQATSANQLTISLCPITGMLAGGVLYQFFGITIILLFNAVSNFISAMMESRLKVPVSISQKAASIRENFRHSLRDLADGYRYVKGNKPVFSFLWINNMFNTISLPAGMVFISYFFNVYLKASAVNFAVPQAFTWVGMIAVTLVIPLVMKRYKLPRLVCRSLLAMSILTLAGTPIVFGAEIGWLNTIQVSIIWTGVNFLVGCSVNMFIVPLYTFFQEQSTGEFRGRFWGIENSLRTLALGIGYLLAGILAQSINLTILFAVYGVITAGIAILARRIKIPVNGMCEKK